MLERVSPQITSTQSYYVSTIVQPSKVMMHAVEDKIHASDDEDEETQEACCEEDLDELSVDKLPLMVRMVSNQVKKTMKNTPPGNHSTPRKGKAAEKPPPATAPVPSVPVLQPSPSMNPAPASRTIAPKSTVPQTIVPQVHYLDPKVKEKDTIGSEFHFQCPIED